MTADPRLQLPTNSVADAPTEYAAYGVANYYGEVIGMLRFRFADDTWRAFPYYALGGLAYDPALGLELDFPAARVRVRGRNLFQLFTLVGDHAVRWCWEADRAACLRARDDAPLIERIELGARSGVTLAGWREDSARAGE